MLPKIICVLLVVCVAGVVGYRDEDPGDGGGSYRHYSEDTNEDRESLADRRHATKQTVKTLDPREIEAVKGAIKQILSGHKQDTLFSPMPSNENLEKRSVRDKPVYEPVTEESYDNRYIRTKINYFTEQTDETKSESTSTTTSESENDISSTNEGTDEKYETNELNAKGPTRSSLPIPFQIDELSSTDETTKESSQTETNEELIGATEAIDARWSSSGTTKIDDTLSSTEGSTKEDYQTDTNEELRGSSGTISTPSLPPSALTFQTVDESTKENYPIQGNDFIATRYKADDSLSSTDESSSIENYQKEANNQAVRQGPDENEEEPELKETESKESEPKDTEIQESNAEQTAIKDSESKESEPKDTEIQESNAEQTTVKDSKVQEDEIEEGYAEETSAKARETRTITRIFTRPTTKTKTKKEPTTTTETTTTTKRTTKFQLDVPALLEIIANLTYDYEMNLTNNLNETLLRLSIPTCETPTTTEKIGYFIDYDANATGTIVAKCFVCGLEEESIPRHAQCADAFAGDFLPLVPVDMTARGRISKYRKYCRYLDVPHYLVNRTMPRSVYGRWTGGCSVRWIDLSGIYTQRSCRNRNRAIMGRHFASKRMAKLEMALTALKDGCISSPMATLVPLSRGISLYARFHACVCTGSWCNTADHHHWFAVPLVSVTTYLVMR